MYSLQLQSPFILDAFVVAGTQTYFLPLPSLLSPSPFHLGSFQKISAY